MSETFQGVHWGNQKGPNGVVALRLMVNILLLVNKLNIFIYLFSLRLANILTIQMDIWKIVYLNWGERHEDIVDHRIYTHNLDSCEMKAWKKFRPERGFKPMTSAIPVLCSTNWAIKPPEYSSHCEFVMYP